MTEAMTKDRLTQILRMRIGVLEFDARTSRVLFHQDVQTVADLVSMNRDQLKLLRSLGEVSINRLEKKLNSFGLWLGMELPEGWNRIAVADGDDSHPDMVLRDKIAMEVLRSVLSDTDEIVDAAITASYCYGIANAMLAARQKFMIGGGG